MLFKSSMLDCCLSFEDNGYFFLILLGKIIYLLENLLFQLNCAMVGTKTATKKNVEN